MKATQLLAGQMRLRCLDGRIPEAFVLDKKKLLVGSAENCDIQLCIQGISSYHVFLFVKNEGLMVKDLFSETGVFVNGKRVNESFVGSGDVLTIGNLSFAAEMLDDAPPVFNADEKIEALKVEPIMQVELPSREGLVFIDGEYCDIKFNEESWRPISAIPVAKVDGDYVDLDQSIEPLEIIHHTKDRRLEIISYVNGLMMDVTYLKLRDGDFYLGSDKSKKNVLPFHTIERTKIFTIQDGKLRFYPNDKITPSSAWDKINLNDTVFLTHGSEQISIRLVNQATGWSSMPMFYRDREFLIKSSKVFAGMFLPMLLLLFVSLPTPEEMKNDVAIVYTIKTPVQKPSESEVKSEVAAQEITSQTENTGHKENDQPIKPKVEFAQASQKTKQVAKAAAPQPVAEPVAAKPVVKAYEFKSSVALGSVTADAPNLNAATHGSVTGKTGMKDVAFNAGTSDKGALVAGADIGVGKFNGSDSKGNGSGSYGARGLASKKGFDTAYLEPKTVVLGSMDPELLRKILREYIPQFRHCYQQELIGHDEKIKGVIDLNFTINANGKVSRYDIRVKDAQFSKKGTNCMGNVLGLIDFPKPKGGGVVDVRQPLNFLSESEKI
jgi:hypothetical protein